MRPLTRVVLIVGASSGIGRACAHLLAARGDHLVLASRGKLALEATARECLEAGAASVLVHPVDVTDGPAVEQLVTAVLEQHGRLDVVVYTAGVVAYGRFESIPADVFDQVLRTNVLGAAHVARAALPVLRRQRSGSLVLTGSVLGHIAVPGMTPYVVSKWAVRSLGRQLALENRDLPDVRVIVVSPGSVDTPIYRQGANYSGRVSRPPAPVDNPQRVAKALVDSLDRPRDRVSVGRLNPLMRLGFTVLPGVFDRIVGPLYRLVAQKPGTQAPTTGNVFAPVAELEAVTGGESQGLVDLAGRLRGR